MAGQIRVGRIVYEKGKPIHPSYSGFTDVVVMTKSSKYGDLSPFELKNDLGQIMENIWQFHKWYPWIPKSTQRYSRWDSTVIWEHPKEIHRSTITSAVFPDGVPTEEYWAWREKGMDNAYAVRYPVGNTGHRSKCICVLTDEHIQLNIREGREQVYLAVYAELVKKQKKYLDLKKRLKGGENLLIIEVDGPHQESLDYYKETYGVGDDFIEDSTILVTPENMEIMIGDPKHSFGHGYCLGMCLLDLA